MILPDGMPRDDDGPVFREPWEAQAFALTLRLHESGHFTWPEWAETLAAEIAAAQAAGDPDLGDTYYRHWLRALERLLASKGILAPDALEARAAALSSHDHGDGHRHGHSE
ncbi:MAG TPA: nitrile hydratase accessory protein [Arenibaculum sp.]|nr:nitrile hydratase accessory protein [Arenibaculum sp.]